MSCKVGVEVAYAETSCIVNTVLSSLVRHHSEVLPFNSIFERIEPGLEAFFLLESVHHDLAIGLARYSGWSHRLSERV